MKKHRWRMRMSWSRLLLWVFASCVAGFYTILWFRSNPGDEHPLSTATGGTTRAGARPRGKTSVSIIVPARNEERNIRRVITSLLEQDFGNYEVIVVDDASTDATPRILDDIARTHPHANRLYVLRLRDLPPGWAGKPHALQAGAKEAQGDWLLFTDADTWHAPNALRIAVETATRDCLDMLSLGTTQELPDFWGKVLMPMAYMGITMQYPPKQVNDPNSKLALANGQFILLRRSVYELLGGYARPDLRDTLLDDRDLARVFKDNGYRLRLVDGRGLVRVRMYQGFRDAWRGWRKNVFLGSRGGLPFVSLQLLGLPLFIVFPFFLPLLALLRRGKRETPRAVTPAELTAASVLSLGPLLAYRVWVNKNLGVPWYYALTQPLAGAVFEGILAQSTWRILTGKGVDWRGRAYYNGHKAGKGESLHP
ncbi:MAG TPA: glycosyltransferase family 2 protein [Ktedonobacteraceae bacterium]|nr:glycosyltransferase family 2 protein [Ktedonobacteraceae bacterium]